MDMPEVDTSNTEHSQELLGSSSWVLTHLLDTKNDLLKIPPIFKVPIELSMFLFIAINIYKSAYVVYYTNRLMLTLFTGITIVALILERTAVVANTDHIWINVVLCIILPFLMRYNRAVAVIFTSVFISYSTPLAFATDLFFILCACLKSKDSIPPEFYIVNLGYIGICCSISISLNFQETTASAITISAVYFIVFYGLLTLLFMYLKTGYSRWSKALYVQIELISYLLFPTMLDIFCNIQYGGKLTYYIPYLKTL